MFELKNVLYETEHPPRIENIKPGDRVEIVEYDEVTGQNRLVDYSVLAVYPYIVYARHGSRHKCLNYGDLVSMGIEFG